MQIYDTKLRKKVDLQPEKGDTIRMYTCGPTVYNFAHIGNLRTFLFEDILRRSIKYFGMKINHVMNFTDVDDKTIDGAKRAHLPLREFTKQYTEAFLEDLQTLNIERAEKYVAATDYIEQMINLIADLVKKNVAYVGSDGNVFFRIAKFPAYGALSHLCLEELKVGASERVSEDEYDKESISDFVLWKAYDEARDGDVFWNSPWGKGRPGWHIECSAMAMHCLGETIDLHVGGVDNIFPHHENEIAQSEASTGKTFARHWMHSAHLLVDGKKMSKSLGNFYVLNDLLRMGYSGREVRYLLISTHYRISLNFTLAGLDGARSTLRRIDDFIERLQGLDGEDKTSVSGSIAALKKAFGDFLADDLNISGAFGAFFDFIRWANSLCDQNQIGKRGAEEILACLAKLDGVFGIMKKGEAKIPLELEEALRKRNEARAEKNWKQADSLRDFIDKAGFIIEDSPSGSRLKPKL